MSESEAIMDVTPDRVWEVIDSLGFTGTHQGDSFYTFVNGCPVRFDATRPGVVSVCAYFFQHLFPVEKRDELVEWVNGYNYNTFFTSVYIREEESGELAVGADSPVLLLSGATDFQLRLATEVALQAVLEFAKNFFEHFGLSPVGPEGGQE